MHHKVNYQSNKELWAQQLCSLRDSVEGSLGCSPVQFQSIHLLPALRVGGEGLEPVPAVSGWRRGSTLDKSPVHLRAETNQRQTTVHTHTYSQFRVATFTSVCTSLHCGRLVQFIRNILIKTKIQRAFTPSFHTSEFSSGASCYRLPESGALRSAVGFWDTLKWKKELLSLIPVKEMKECSF